MNLGEGVVEPPAVKGFLETSGGQWDFAHLTSATTGVEAIQGKRSFMYWPPHQLYMVCNDRVISMLSPILGQGICANDTISFRLYDDSVLFDRQPDPCDHHDGSDLTPQRPM